MRLERLGEVRTRPDVVDNAIQVCGATGISGDAPLARMMNELRPFRIYDGPTETHILLTGSPTIDAGDPAFNAPPDFEQRGVPFTRTFDGDGVGGVRIDMGAVEVQTAGGAASADFDADEDVDGFDFLLWQLGYGITSGASQSDGDATFDGAVTSGDLSVWELQYGTAAPLVAAASALIATEPVAQPSLASSELADVALAVSLAEEGDGAASTEEEVALSPPLDFFSHAPILRGDSATGPSSSSSATASTLGDDDRESSEGPSPWEDAVDEVFAFLFRP